MRRWMLLVVIAALMLALASVAIARFSQSSEVTLTTSHTGRSTGISADVHARDPAAPGFKPKRATKLVLTFPAGTRFNLGTSLVRNCTLTDKRLMQPFGPSCPRGSLIGTGSAIVNAMPMAPKAGVGATASVYVRDASSMLIVLLNDPTLLPGTPPIIIHATVSGRRLTMQLPHVVYGKSKKYKYAGITAVIARLKLSIAAMGSGAGALITSGRCTDHRFVVASHFSYADHTTASLSSSSRCG